MTAADLHCVRGYVLVVALVLGAAQTAAADGLRAGQWRTVNSPEIDGVAGPVQQSIRCLTPEAVADLDKTFSPISRTTNSTCERVEHESTPQRLIWRLWRENSRLTAPNTTRPSLPRAHSCSAASCNRYARRSKDSVWATARSRLARWTATALTLSEPN